MKKIYTLAMAMLIVSATWAQSSLTFQVDMAGLTVSANGVHIAGDFQSAAGAPGNWDPAATALTQVGTTTIYSVTVSVPNGNYQYKYLNGNAWGDDEGIPAASQVSAGLGFDNGNSNRWVHVTGTDTTAAVMFAGNAPAGHSAVSMVLDMGLEASIDSVVSIAGNFQGWSPGSTELYDLLADSMYRFIAYIPTTDTMNFKYVNGSAWGDDESVPSGCQVNNNRQLIISGDTVFGPTCYAQCGPCFVPDTFNVTIQVDMSGASCSFDPATDSVDFAGPYNSWGGGDYLTDPDGDMIYDITVYVPSPEFTYKARIIKGGSPTWEPGGNNVVTFIGDTLVPARCFGVATAGACPPQPNPSDLTFQVDMSNGPASFVKVFLIGDFTDPQWQGGAIELTASATQPGVFETTVLQVCPGKISFKYMIEDGTGTQIEESFLAASDTTCLEPSGTGDFNRFYQRPDDQPKTIAAPWEDCASSIGLGENLGASVNIYPNPSKGITNIELPTGKHQVRIYNLIGSVVASFNDVENNLQWNAGNLTTGVYVVSVTNELGFTATQKVVLK
jgi:hypothetical protein